MKRFKLLALLLCGVIFLGAAPLSKVPTSGDAYKLNKWLGPVAFDIYMGDKFREAHKVATGVWDFSLVGGTAESTSLNVGITLPDNAVIRRVVTETLTSPVTAGTTALCFQTGESACDLFTWTDTASWSGFQEGTPDDEVANFVKLTAERDIKMAVSGTSVTAGKIKVYLDYLLSE